MSDPLDTVFGSQKLRRDAASAIREAIDPAAYEGLIEFEILGKNLFPPGVAVLRDGSAVAVSKDGLVAAYYEVLTDIDGVRLTSKADDALYAQDSIAETLRSFAILVLLQPEHLLAINLRKSLLSHCWPSSLGLYHDERRFIDSILTSPLHKHNKSPTLWYHRQWIVTRLFRHGSDDVLDDLKAVVFVAAEKHPRNYYAWNHARFLMGLMDWSAGNRPQQARTLQAVLDWCKRHHDDTSGWSFLLSMLLGQGRYESQDAAVALRDVLELADSLRWTNESVWVFLRTLAASKMIRDPEYQEFLRVNAALEARTDDRNAKKVLQAAMTWCVTYREA